MILSLVPFIGLCGRSFGRTVGIIENSETEKEVGAEGKCYVHNDFYSEANSGSDLENIFRT